MTQPLRSIRLQGYDSREFNNRTFQSGDITWDRELNTLRIFDGVTPGGESILANQIYVNNAINTLAGSITQDIGALAAVATSGSYADLSDTPTPVTIGATPPSTPVNGDIWLSTQNGRLYVYYADADSSQWIQPSQSNLSISANGVNSGVANSLSYYADAGNIISTTGANLTWNEFTNVFQVVGNISATTFTGNLTGNVSGTLTGNVIGNVSGSAGSVANGVSTTGSYANPSWITSLDIGKVTNAVSTASIYEDPNWIASLAGSKVTGVVQLSGSYANPSWISSLDATKLTGNFAGNALTVTNGVYTSGAYADPVWMLSLSGSKVSGDISGNAANVTSTVAATHGGTGQTVYATGDILYATSTTQVGKLGLSTSGYVLTSGASVPTYVAQSTLSVGSAQTAGLATYLANGTAGAIAYQSAPGSTSFVTLGTTGYLLVAGASAPTYTNSISGIAVQQRVVTAADGTSITVNATTSDMVTQANTQPGGTLTINAPTGSPTDGQRLTLRIRSTVSQTLSWNTVFAGSADITLPISSSGNGLYDYIGFMYNSTANKWQIMGKNFGF